MAGFDKANSVFTSAHATFILKNVFIHSLMYSFIQTWLNALCVWFESLKPWRLCLQAMTILIIRVSTHRGPCISRLPWIPLYKYTENRIYYYFNSRGQKSCMNSKFTAKKKKVSFLLCFYVFGPSMVHAVPPTVLIHVSSQNQADLFTHSISQQRHHTYSKYKR